MSIYLECAIMVREREYINLVIVVSRSRFGCYSLIRTGSAGQVLGGKVASGSKVGRMYI
jgi:hypothetical protein